MNSNPFPGSRPNSRQEGKLHTQVVARTPIAGVGTTQKSTPNGTIITALPQKKAFVETHPFKVSFKATGRKVKVKPGLIYNHSLDPTWHMPQINNTDLDAEDTPEITMAGTTGFICLVAEFGTDGAAVNTPWQIDSFASVPSDTLLSRVGGINPTPQQGIYHILIASVKEGAVYQWVKSNMVVNVQWEQLFVIA